MHTYDIILWRKRRELALILIGLEVSNNHLLDVHRATGERSTTPLLQRFPAFFGATFLSPVKFVTHMWPAVPHAAQATVVSRDAVWLQQWVQRHAQSKAPKGTWTRAALVARVSRFGELLAQAERIGEKTEEEATVLADEVDQIMQSVGDARTLQQFASKELKRQRKEVQELRAH